MIKTAVFGYGNVGKAVVDTLLSTPDFELAGIVDPVAASRGARGDSPPLCPSGHLTVDASELPKIDVAILAVPSRIAPDLAADLLQKGICTVDSFDIHPQIADVRRKLDGIAKANKTAAIISAGWDPGTDSIVRALFEVMAPAGITYTNFGPGMSMGHTVAAKAIPGVNDALSVTIPVGTGIHRRMVYIELKEGYEFDNIVSKIKSDDYFKHDDTHVILTDDVRALKDTGHGVNIERRGVSGNADNQFFNLVMRMNGPALTAQVLVCSARAVMKRLPGCYTLIEIPPVEFLAMTVEEAVKRFV